jgi:hypothetical protein
MSKKSLKVCYLCYLLGLLNNFEVEEGIDLAGKYLYGR